MIIVLDVNIWISFAIGKRLSALRKILVNNKVEVYYSSELLKEFITVAKRPKLTKYISEERLEETLALFEATCIYAELGTQRIKRVRDEKDNYLLELCLAVKANYLVTGDNDLLDLHENEDTRIITFNELKSILDKG